MMNVKLIGLSVLFLAVSLFQSIGNLAAQTAPFSNLQSQYKSGQVSGKPLVQEAVRPKNPASATPSKRTASQAAAKPKSPWQISGRIHLEKGTNEGYLVVQIDLDQGYHVYSLDPKGSPSPTRLAVLPSNDLRVKSKFVSDKAPLVIEKDPVFGQRIEKHKGQVQFFAPIEIRGGVDIQKLVQEVQFSGQVCSDSACQPIRNHTLNAEFAGYFEIPKTGQNANGQQQLK